MGSVERHQYTSKAVDWFNLLFDDILPFCFLAKHTHALSRLIYSLLFYCLLPFVVLRILWRSLREPLYRQDLAQRFGYAPKASAEGQIWVHAVSAGESIAAIPLINALLARDYRVVVTNMTPTGRERITAALGDAVVNCYAPWDLPDAVRRFIRRVRPAKLILIDTELWPNMIAGASAAGAEIYLVNARLSARSAHGYGRISGLTRRMLQALSGVGAQSAVQGERFVALGLPAERLTVTGSIKFDAPLPADLAEQTTAFRHLFADRYPVTIASTQPGEEALIVPSLRAWLPANPDVLVILAPRHPHRADSVEQLLLEAGLAVARRSRGDRVTPRIQVYLLDTMGELQYAYAVSRAAYVGGSLVDVGGHNPMEPAAFGIPVIMGSYLRNIRDIADLFAEAGGLRIVHTGSELVALFDLYHKEPEQAAHDGSAAKSVLENNRGALQASLHMLAI
ncbi:MAG: lipid IV(A) 3-deoxy-D-manno-octulosonic acid transferase [Pseudomonadales bacterium]|nr:lipid IV(A) 3-deoxy-D-manno-octulosonic acid transferase [Pseudomonadales bacterium]